MWETTVRVGQAQNYSVRLGITRTPTELTTASDVLQAAFVSEGTRWSAPKVPTVLDLA